MNKNVKLSILTVAALAFFSPLAASDAFAYKTCICPGTLNDKKDTPVIDHGTPPGTNANNWDQKCKEYEQTLKNQTRSRVVQDYPKKGLVRVPSDGTIQVPKYKTIACHVGDSSELDPPKKKAAVASAGSSPLEILSGL